MRPASRISHLASFSFTNTRTQERAHAFAEKGLTCDVSTENEIGKLARTARVSAGVVQLGGCGAGGG